MKSGWLAGGILARAPTKKVWCITIPEITRAEKLNNAVRVFSNLEFILFLLASSRSCLTQPTAPLFPAAPSVGLRLCRLRSGGASHEPSEPHLLESRRVRGSARARVPHPFFGVCETMHEPARDLGNGLVATPTPGHLDRHSPDPGVAGLFDARRTVVLTALIGCRRQSRKRPTFLPFLNSRQEKNSIMKSQALLIAIPPKRMRPAT